MSNHLPPVPTKDMLILFIRRTYQLSSTVTERFISPYEISDDIMIQYGYRFYPAEIRNLLKELGHEPVDLPTKVKGYYLTT